MSLLSMFRLMFGRIEFRKLSMAQKLYFTVIVISCCLIFYAIGIITNFFASPIFSMFFIISYETAHNIAIYVALTTAFGLSVAALAVAFLRKRKSVLTELADIPEIDNFRVTTATLPHSNSTPSVNDKEIMSHSESQDAEQENELNQQPDMRPFLKATSLTSENPKTENDETNSSEPVILLINNQLTCPTCKREFVKPVFVLDYSGLRPRLIRRCPYCERPLDSTQNASLEDSYMESSVSLETEQ
jgi:hypothetical protein